MWIHMVHQMEVIVQKQKHEKSTIFNNSGARLHVFMGAVLGKCTDLDKRKAAVGHEKIGPKRVARRRRRLNLWIWIFRMPIHSDDLPGHQTRASAA